MYERNNIDDILVVDDCSTENNYQLFPFVYDTLVMDSNVGFLKSANAGLRAAAGNGTDIIVLLSNDVEIHGKFIDSIKLSTDDNTLVGGMLLNRDTGWNNFSGRIFPYLEGWLLAATRNGWEKLGYLDENFAPNDFEDVDLSTKAINLGMELVAINSPALHHLGGRSIGYSQEREALTKRNRIKFEQKWLKS